MNSKQFTHNFLRLVFTSDRDGIGGLCNWSLKGAYDLVKIKTHRNQSRKNQKFSIFSDCVYDSTASILVKITMGNNIVDTWSF